MRKLFLLFFLFSLVSLKTGNEFSLKQTKHCQVNNQIIQAKARALKRSSDLETAKNVFHFVQYDIKYEEYSDTKKVQLRL